MCMHTAPEKAKGPEEQDVKVGETVDVIRKDAVSEVCKLVVT